MVLVKLVVAKVLEARRQNPRQAGSPLPRLPRSGAMRLEVFLTGDLKNHKPSRCRWIWRRRW